MNYQELSDYAHSAQTCALNFGGVLFYAPVVSIDELERAAYFFKEAARLRRLNERVNFEMTSRHDVV
jgi:hypothetical protein